MQERVAETEQAVDRIGWRTSNPQKRSGMERQVFAEEHAVTLEVESRSLAFETSQYVDVCGGFGLEEKIGHDVEVAGHFTLCAPIQGRSLLMLLFARTHQNLIDRRCRYAIFCANNVLIIKNALESPPFCHEKRYLAGFVAIFLF